MSDHYPLPDYPWEHPSDRAEEAWLAAEDFFRNREGLFVGQLSAGELETFERLIREGLARRSYEGATGFRGLAKVRRS